MTTTNKSHTAPSSVSSVTVVRRFVDEVLNQRRFEHLSEIIHPNYRYEGPDGTVLCGPRELEALIASFHTGFSDFHAAITSEVHDGDLVAMTMTLTGTHDGEFDSLPPTGGRMNLSIAIFTRVENDRIVEDREYYDTATLLAQLGV